MPTIADPGCAVAQRGQERLHEGGLGPQVDLEHGVEAGGVERMLGRRHRDTRRVHESADGAERGEGGLDARVDRVRVAHVDLVRARRHAELGGALVGDGLGAGTVEVPRRDGSTDLGEGTARLPPDSRCSPGDDHRSSRPTQPLAVAHVMTSPVARADDGRATLRQTTETGTRASAR